jgi:alkylation response protein AidB-like acyl-CoA dehydrogenase
VPEAALAAPMAKACSSDAYRRVAGAGIKLHGGIGFTWDQTALDLRAGEGIVEFAVIGRLFPRRSRGGLPHGLHLSVNGGRLMV